MTNVFEPTEFAREFEIKLPDAECRRRLLELYLRDLPGGVPDLALEPIVAATDGVSAAFVRELVRRAVLLAVDEAADEAAGGSDGAVGERHLRTALGRPRCRNRSPAAPPRGRHRSLTPSAGPWTTPTSFRCSPW